MDEVKRFPVNDHEAMSDSVKRYVCPVIAQGREVMMALPDGPYVEGPNRAKACVLYTDHLARLAEVEAERDALKGKFSYGIGDGSDKSNDVEWLRGGFLQRGAEIEKLQADLAALRQAQTWRDISEAPKDGSDIIITDGLNVDVAHWSTGKFCAGHGYTFNSPTGWMPMPLPAPPTTPKAAQ